MQAHYRRHLAQRCLVKSWQRSLEQRVKAALESRNVPQHVQRADRVRQFCVDELVRMRREPDVWGDHPDAIPIQEYSRERRTVRYLEVREVQRGVCHPRKYRLNELQ